MKGLDRTTLEAVAARALGGEPGDHVDVTSFRSEQVVGGYGVNLGVHRWTGSARYRGQDVPWAAVLKIVDGSQDDGADGSWDYWRREASAYESGLLADLPGGLSAPRFLGLEERSDGTLWLWLESVSMEDDPIWPIPRYGLAARHLGQFNAGYLVDRPLPSGAPWLARQWLRSWVNAAEPAVNLFRAVRDEPLVSRAYPSEVATGILRLWDEKERWLTLLESLPQSLCHQDAFRRNLISRVAPTSTLQTVAFDWTFMGFGPLGAELAPLVVASTVLEEVNPLSFEELEEVCLAGYQSGLEDAGWHGDPAQIRLGYAASAALRYPLGCLRLMLPPLLLESKRRPIEVVHRRPFDEIVDLWGAVSYNLIGLADKARLLAARNDLSASETGDSRLRR